MDEWVSGWLCGFGNHRFYQIQNNFFLNCINSYQFKKNLQLLEISFVANKCNDLFYDINLLFILIAIFINHIIYILFIIILLIYFVSAILFYHLIAFDLK